MSIQGLKDITGNARILRISNNNEGTGLVDLNKIRKEQKAKLFVSNEPDTFPNDPPNNGTDAKDGLYEAVEQTKIKHPQELLLQPGKAPVKDQKRIDGNKKLAKTSALIQLLDGIAGAVNLQRKQEEAVVAPQNLVPGAFEAVNNIRAINQKYDLDLHNYNRRQEEIEAQNKAILQQATAHNANVDVKLAQLKRNDAIEESNKALSEERAKALAQDKTAERLYEVGLRFISNGNTDVGKEYFKMAGLANEEIDNMLKSTNNSLSESDKIGIRRYHTLQNQLNDPTTSLIRQERINEEIKTLRDIFGDKLFSPESEWKETSGNQNGSSSSTKGDPNAPIDPNRYINIARTLHDYTDFRDGKMPALSNNEESINKYVKWMVDKAEKEKDQEMDMAIMARMKMDLQNIGLSNEQIDQKMSAILNEDKKNTEQEKEVVESYPFDIEAASNEQVAQAFRDNIIGLDEVKAKSELLWRVLKNNSSAEIPPALKIKDGFKQFVNKDRSHLIKDGDRSVKR